jgi:hypothetical protein
MLGILRPSLVLEGCSQRFPVVKRLIRACVRPEAYDICVVAVSHDTSL